MNILALEFSSEQRSVAVLKAGGVPVQASIQTDPRHLTAFELIETALTQSQLEREEIGCIAVGIGPGSYTGIRAAIVISQAWHLGIGVRVLGIGSVDCLAVQAQAQNLLGQISFIIDAQRNEFYLAGYEISPSEIRVIKALQIVPYAEISGRQQLGEVFAGPEIRRWFPNSPALFPEAAALARLAADRHDFINPASLEPIYLRENTFVKANPLKSAPKA